MKKIFHHFFGTGTVIKTKELVEQSGRMLYVQFAFEKIWVDESNIEYID